MYKANLYEAIFFVNRGDAVEERRRLEGKVPRVRFLNTEEQQSWEQQGANSLGQSERRGEDDHA